MLRDNNGITAQFAHGLKSRSSQNKTSRDLLLFLRTELREMPPDESQAFIDDLNHHIIEMILSSDVVEKKGGVLAISELTRNFYNLLHTQPLIQFVECLISGEAVNTTASISRNINNLRNLFPCSDVNVMELAARTLVKLGQLPGSKGAESFEFEIKKAFELISDDKNDVSFIILHI
jgi:serine/threonine-protein kinase mTOR